MNSEVCAFCTQKGCRKKGDPQTVDEVFTGNRHDSPGFDHTDCFFFRCEAGQFAAINSYRAASKRRLSGLIPFGTSDHKPFMNGSEYSGRFVAVGNVEGENGSFANDGDIVIENVGGQIIRLTNLKVPPVRVRARR